MTTLVDYGFGPEACNRLAEAGKRGEDGALAVLETFYYALNHADLDTLTAVWSDDDLVQLDNPVGGILRSRDAVTDLYQRIFTSGIDVQVTFTDAATYLSTGIAVYAGREVGSYRSAAGDRKPLEIRTTRVFGWQDHLSRWAQLHHHGSIDNPQALAAYQTAARHARQ